MELAPLRHDGRDRPYRVHAPAGRTDPAPLLVELHGRGVDAVRFDRLTGFGALAEEAGFVLALPSAVEEIWNDGRDPQRADGPDDVSYLRAVIDDVRRRYPIDSRRVYLVGMSNGAAMAGRFACAHPERLAAFAQVAGTAAASIVAAATPGQTLPILEIHGSADEVAPYTGGIRRRLRARLLIRRPFGPSVGVDQWAKFWVDTNSAAPQPELTRLPPDTTIRTWRDAQGVPVVVFYRVSGGGHTWPRSRIPLPRLLFGRTTTTFDATRTIWQFLAGHSRAD
jgi:polyhydroxybutyrate depolymerase